MTDETDAELLRRYVGERSERAFAELVRRRIDLVYSVARRSVGGDAHLAEDVTQQVFAALARKAPALAPRAVLTGWLYRSAQFAAADVVRAERRRRARESASSAMPASSPPPDPTLDGDQLRPLLDAALADLSDADRDAVALRFFENRSFAAIGAALQLSEDTARKKVERALAKLHAALARRGVGSTAAAVGVALAGQASLAAPAGLAASVTAGALGTATATVAATGASSLLALMNTPSATLIAGALALAALNLALSATHDARAARLALSAATRDQAGLLARVAALDAKLAVAAQQAASADRATAALLATARTVSAAGPAAPATPITSDLVDSRFRRGRDLAQRGQASAALTDLLWCFDEGMVQVAHFHAVRTSFLLSEIARLGTTYPPALDALRARRDRARQQLTASTDDDQAADDFASLNDALGENRATLRVYDELPLNDERRRTLASGIFDQLLEDRRYPDALQGLPYEQMLAQFDHSEPGQPPRAARPDSAASDPELRHQLIATTATNVEVLAGAGELDHARTLATRLLAADSSAEARDALRQHLLRAGHPDLLGDTLKP